MRAGTRADRMSAQAHSADPSQLRELEVLKSQFLASLNHEIRTPISGVLGMTDLLLETSLDNDQRDYVIAARESASQLLDTLNGILEYCALSAGDPKPLPSEFPLRQTLQNVVSESQEPAAEKGLELHLDVDDSVPETSLGDARSLRLVFTHLLRNAIKFTTEGRIALRASASAVVENNSSSAGCLLRVEIEDTGIGIPPEKVRLIFESFRQLDSGRSRGYSGLGLGLAIVEKLLAGLGGEVQVESQPGKGSLFTVRVPLQVPSLALAAEEGLQSRPSSSGRRILLVEDNRIAQQVICHFLRQARFEVTCAGNGREGVMAAAAARFDLILMDLQMPEMDGLEATTSIRALPGYQRVPVLALTANSSQRYRRRCQEIGMQGFLSKPINRDEVLCAVSEFLS